MMNDRPSFKDLRNGVEICRYFFRCNVMRVHLEDLIRENGGFTEAVKNEWDRFWAYYTFWLSGLWVTCEGIVRIKFGEEGDINFAKILMSELRSVRQSTFHYKPNINEMLEHLNTERPLADLWKMHDRIQDVVKEFLRHLPPDFIDSLPD